MSRVFELTPQRLAIWYDALRQMPPFSRWRLPVADDVEFRTPMRYDIFGEHVSDPQNGVCVITVSIAMNGHLDTVLRTLAHEMGHAAEVVAGRRMTHGPHFRRRMLAVGASLGWDGKAL